MSTEKHMDTASLDFDFLLFDEPLMDETWANCVSLADNTGASLLTYAETGNAAMKMVAC